MLSEEETEYNKNAELYIDIKGDLIPKFYKNKLCPHGRNKFT